MPLTHVCVWDSKIGYRRVSVEEASRLYPFEVSSSSGHFVCELCAQNVGFSKARVDTGTRYFFHSSAAQNKDCEDRQTQLSNATNQRLVSLNNHTMPFRINVNGARYTLQLGFFFPPDTKAYCDRIKISDDSHQVYEYSFERIERVGTTYLSVGTTPSRVYGIEYVNGNAELKKYWNNKVNGVNPSGSLFDGRTGHILLSGAKAYSNNTYFLLQRRSIYMHSNDLEITEVCRTHVYTSWYLYKIRVKRFSESSAKFFLKYSIFLTDKPTKFFPLWPPYTTDPLFIYHNSSSFYFYLCGDDVELKAYPASSNVLSTNDGKLYKLFTREREQLISLGKSGSLGFSYLIKQSLNKKTLPPSIIVRDLSGSELFEDICPKLPKSKYISVSCQYDGKAVVYKQNRTTCVHKLSHTQDLIIDDLSYDTAIDFYQGCDLIRTLRFERPSKQNDFIALDDDLVKQLQGCKGPTISVTHSIGVLISKYSDFPKTKQWICTTLRQGEISRKALQILQKNLPNI